MRTRPDTITRIDLAGGSFTVDEAGYLTDPSAWTEEFACHIAEQEGLVLSPLHWDVVRFIRNSELEHGIMPDARFVMRFLGESDGGGKNSGRRILFELFPYGYVKQAIKIAGMKQPRAWSTG